MLEMDGKTDSKISARKSRCARDTSFDTDNRSMNFLTDVRITLCDESLNVNSPYAKQSSIFANTAGNIVTSSIIMREEFTSRLPGIIRDHDVLHGRLKTAQISSIPCWIEIHNGPVSTGFLFAVYAPHRSEDALVMMRSFRDDSKGATPYVVSWKSSNMRRARRIGEALNIAYVNRDDAPSDKAREVAYKIAMIGMSALIFRLYPDIIDRTAERLPEPTVAQSVTRSPATRLPAAPVHPLHREAIRA